MEIRNCEKCDFKGLETGCPTVKGYPICSVIKAITGNTAIFHIEYTSKGNKKTDYDIRLMSDLFSNK